MPRDSKTEGDDTNAPDRDTILFFTGQFRSAEEKIKEARTAKKRLRHRAKLIGIEVEQLDKAIAEMDRDDNTTIEQLSAFRRYCEFLGLPLGYQMTLFTDPKDAKKRSREDLNAKAHRQGYENGIQGINPDEQAYPPMTPEGQEHMRGWHEGQKVLLDKIGRLSEDMKADETAKAAKKKGKDVKEPTKEQAEENFEDIAA